MRGAESSNYESQKVMIRIKIKVYAELQAYLPGKQEESVIQIREGARVFNLREGLGEKEDRLPERLHQGLEGGLLKGEKIDPEEFARAREMYYGMMGWDPQSGVPSKYKLEELNVGWTLPLLKS